MSTEPRSVAVVSVSAVTEAMFRLCIIKARAAILLALQCIASDHRKRVEFIVNFLQLVSTHQESGAESSEALSITDLALAARDFRSLVTLALKKSYRSVSSTNIW